MSFLSSHRLDTAKAGLFAKVAYTVYTGCIENRKQQKGEVRQYLSVTIQTIKQLYREYIWRAPHITFLSGHRTYSGYRAEMGQVRQGFSTHLHVKSRETGG